MKGESAVFKILDLPNGGSLVPFPSAPGQRVRILQGRVWLTEEGSPRDAFLASGEEVTLGSRGLAVIEALSPARVQLFESIGRAGTVLNACAAVNAIADGVVGAAVRRPITTPAHRQLCEEQTMIKGLETALFFAVTVSALALAGGCRYPGIQCGSNGAAGGRSADYQAGNGGSCR